MNTLACCQVPTTVQQRLQQLSQHSGAGLSMWFPHGPPSDFSADAELLSAANLHACSLFHCAWHIWGWPEAGCGEQDVLARYKTKHSSMKDLPSKACFQMNDTHPTIAVAELMRLLIDQEGLDWDAAWGITTKVPQPRPGNCKRLHWDCHAVLAVKTAGSWARATPKQHSTCLET